MKGVAAKDALLNVKPAAPKSGWKSLFLNDGTPVTVNLTDSTLTGSPTNTKLAEYCHQIDDDYQAIGAVVKVLRTLPEAEQAARMSEYRAAYNKLMDDLTAMVEENQDNNIPVGVLGMMGRDIPRDKFVAFTDSTKAYATHPYIVERQRKYAEAARWLELSLRVDSSQYEVWEAMLICLSEVPGREAAMIDYAGRAERMFPMKTLPLYMQAVHLMQQDRHAEALTKLEKARRWGFNKGYLEADTYALMGECYYRTGRYDKAWQAFEHCIGLRPDDWGTLNNYAYYLGEQNTDLEKALAMSRRTIDAEPKNANSLDTYAWLLHLLGRDAEGLPYMRRAAEIDPANETFRRHLKEMTP